MKVNLLKHTVKAPTEYSYAYILITNGKSVEDIINLQKQVKKIVFFGSTPDSHAQWDILQEVGIKPDFACDVSCEFAFDNHGVKMRPYWELIEHTEDYYFILTLPRQEVITNVMKMLFYAGVDDFGIVYSGWSKDLQSSHTPGMREKAFEALNEVFIKEPLFCNYLKLENLRRTALPGLGYWDVLLMSIYKLAKRKEFSRYLEIGAGTGIMSFTLKKLLGDRIDINWLDVPVQEKYWTENHSPNFKELINKYNVTQHLGHIELEELTMLKGQKFDYIVLAQVMEHFIFNPVETFKKLIPLLTDTGKIYVAVPNDYKFYNVRSWKEIPSASSLNEEQIKRRIAINNYGHFHEYSKEEAEEVFKAAGLETIYYRWNDPINFFILQPRKQPI